MILLNIFKNRGFLILFLCGLLFAAVLGNWRFIGDFGDPPKVDAIVVLAGKYEERVPAAISLYRAGSANLIILTNGGAVETWYEELQTNLPEMVCSEKLLLKNGIPKQAIIKLPFMKNGTVYDARAIRMYLKKNPVESVLLVTSDFHTNRALWIFRQVLANLPVRIEVAPVESGWSSAVPIMMEPFKMVNYWVRYGLLKRP